MGIVHRSIRWHKLNHGRGKQIRTQGAIVATCPHCIKVTPVFHTEYDSQGRPLSFSVCVWCNGFIEYNRRTAMAHEPYAAIEEIKNVSVVL